MNCQNTNLKLLILCCLAAMWASVGCTAITEGDPPGLGECGGPLDVDCGEGFFCQFPAESCELGGRSPEITGLCQPIPEACPEIFDPVCGCDGITYDNECLVAAAGENVGPAYFCDEVPPMIEPCGGIEGLECGDGRYCAFENGTCDISDRQGLCTDIPDACLAVEEPVCGCDGNDYTNACMAAAVGVSVDREGICDMGPPVVECGTIAGLECAEGYFCQYEPGTCDISDRAGVCNLIPEACTEEYSPVCGCDGNDYSNGCMAAAAGVSVDREGICDMGPPVLDRCGTIAGLDCAEGYFCQYDPGTCDISDRAGVCTVMPEACPEIYMPVCGCDGRTYGNECEAEAAGASVSYLRACERLPPPERICGTIAGLTCLDTEYCLYPTGSCDVSDRSGRCVPRPAVCTDEYAPVCSCDGRTYSNACEAASAGAPIRDLGECSDVPTPPGSDGLPRR